ncbi:MAG: Type III pantothenate kinase [Flavobacteriaceae bacterium]|nr:MAG: Type III pantothenate kinase [Flavobacteriaceae bacterium]|tara:strand:- start:41428 stop:42156 length:729 start_codon:yes stop_codon:yes gene_type:complete
MLLILDIGNTNIKYALYENDECQHIGVLNSEEDSNFEEIINVHPITHIFYSDVRGRFSNRISTIFPTVKKTSLTTALLKFPFKNNYTTPETLGSDRMALMAAACFKYPKQACLVIDMGSCITYDFIDADAVYYGGSISLGIRMRYEALHKQTARLPELLPRRPESILGQSTEASIHAGVYYGIIAELEYQIDTYADKYSNLKIILTGGDHIRLSKSIKKPIFAEPNFLLEGMQALLQYNTDP